MLPEPVDVDPAALGDEELERRGIRRLPTSLGEAVSAFRSDEVLSAAFGPALVASIVAIRESEIEQYADFDDTELAAATRWFH